MRIPRTIQLTDKGVVHCYWQCHNRTFLFNKNFYKRLYLGALARGLKNTKVKDKVKIFSFVIMDNHVHLVLSYEGGVKILSHFLKVAHTIFGINYNRLENRCGTVNSGRPKTPLIQNDSYSMRTHFYIEANPLRSCKFRKIDDLSKDIFNSYRFFAFGIRDAFTEFLEIPTWYIKLGKNSFQRQRRYRKLFRMYLIKFGLLKRSTIDFFSHFIGEIQWCANQMDKLKNERQCKLILSG